MPRYLDRIKQDHIKQKLQDWLVVADDVLLTFRTDISESASRLNAAVRRKDDADKVAVAWMKITTQSCRFREA